jgi:hypothetical protein
MNVELHHATAAPVPVPNEPRRRRTRREPAVCYHCASNDTMEPFSRPERIFLLSRICPILRRRYCRACTRHFLAFIRA